MEALLLSAQPVPTVQFVNPFSFVTGVAIIACLLIVLLFAAIFIILQVSRSSRSEISGFSYVVPFASEEQRAGNAEGLQQGVHKEAEGDVQLQCRCGQRW